MHASGNYDFSCDQKNNDVKEISKMHERNVNDQHMMYLNALVIALGGKEQSSWLNLVAMSAADPKGLQSQIDNFDRDNVSPQVLKKLEQYVFDPKFNPVQAKMSSMAMSQWVKWVRNVYGYATRPDAAANLLASPAGGAHRMS